MISQPKSIVARLNGGIGNQLFQYAAGFAMSMAWNVPLVLDLPPARREQFLGHPRKFALGEFAITSNIVPFNRFQRLLASRQKCLSRLLWPVRKLLSLELVDEVPGHPFDESLLRGRPTARHVSLWGYWQSYKWAEQYEEALRNELRFRNEPIGENAKMLEQIRSCECAISLHVRRGDFLKVGGAPVLSMEYYRNAISEMVLQIAADQKSEYSKIQLQRIWRSQNDRAFHLKSKISSQEFAIFVFSDDIPWCKQELPQLFSVFPFSGLHFPLFFVDLNDEAHPHEDLRLMSACLHHIVANSSFSWWGAWLNPKEDKIVIRPPVMSSQNELYPPVAIQVGSFQKKCKSLIN